eukprot:TRINITY_DN4076_c0_g1_i5.p1 TRINITY_DN4076_c0_g1~~TRINITY_DN4076_c0_g1_i5.p1  ORF type:complete len:149 (-),score=45.55 TRINITY_DN4076_c0_g1_i5:446-892(-)
MVRVGVRFASLDSLPCSLETISEMDSMEDLDPIPDDDECIAAVIQQLQQHDPGADEVFHEINAKQSKQLLSDDKPGLQGQQEWSNEDSEDDAEVATREGVRAEEAHTTNPHPNPNESLAMNPALKALKMRINASSPMPHKSAPVQVHA